MRQAVNFLKHVYHESVPDIANLVVAEAEGDTDMIIDCLCGVRDYVDKLIEQVNK